MRLRPHIAAVEPVPTEQVEAAAELSLQVAMAVVGSQDPRSSEAMGLILDRLVSLAAQVRELRDVPQQDRGDIINIVALRLLKTRPGTGARCVETPAAAEAYLRSALRNGAVDVFRKDRFGGEYDEERLGGPDATEDQDSEPVECGNVREQVEELLSEEAVVFAFGPILDQAIRDMKKRFRAGRWLALLQIRGILYGHVDGLIALAGFEAERTGKRLGTAYAALQRAHRRAKQGMERACRHLLSVDGIPVELLADVDRVLEAIGCPPLCRLHPVEQLVFGRLVPLAVELQDGEERRENVAAGLQDLVAVYRQESSLPELAAALVRNAGISRSEAKNRLDKRQDMARRALGRAVDSALASGDLEPGLEASSLDILLEALGLGSRLHLHLARVVVFEPLGGGTACSLGEHHARADELLRISRREVTVEELARARADAAGMPFVDALLALKVEHHAALVQLRRWLRHSLEQGGVYPVLEPHIDRILVELGGQAVCLQWRAERLVFEDLASTVLNRARRSERDDARSLDALAWMNDNTLLLEWMFTGLHRVARGERSVDDLVAELDERVDDRDGCWPYGNHRGALAWAVELLEERCTVRLHQIRRELHPAIDAVFVRIGGTRVCDAWTAGSSASLGSCVAAAT